MCILKPRRPTNATRTVHHAQLLSAYHHILTLSWEAGTSSSQGLYCHQNPNTEEVLPFSHCPYRNRSLPGRTDGYHNLALLFEEDSRAMASASSSNVVGVHYRVGKKIGEGSFGVLFEGTNLLNNQQIAIKFVRSSPSSDVIKSSY